MRKYILIKSPVEPQGIPNLENCIWLKYTPTDETEEVSPLEDGYYIWLGMWFKLPFVNGYIDKSLIPEEYITNEELQALTASIDELIDTKSTVVAPMYLNLPDATVVPYTPRGGVWNKITQEVDGTVESVLSNGETAQWANNNSSYVDGYYTWFTIATFEKGGYRIVDWMTPICIRIAKDGKDGKDGIDGTDGKDSMSHSFVYKLLSKSQAASSDFDPYYPSNNDKTRWDFVPAGWTASPSGISEENPIELVCFRIYDPSIELWSDFVGPRIWSQWGQSGKDGDGVEYVYRLARLDGEGAEAYYNAGTDTYHLYEDYWPQVSVQEDDYVPEGWSDDPADVSTAWPIQFVSKRKYDGETKVWGNYTEPVCWNKIPLADIDVEVTAFTSFVFAVTNIDLSHAVLQGGSAIDPEPEHTYVNNQEVEVTWSDTILNGSTGTTWMATRTFINGEPTNAWSTPVRMADSVDFQVEYSADYPWNDDPRPELPNFGNYSSEEFWRAAAEQYGCGTWNDSVEDPSYMATCQMKDGEWSDWVISKIKGENGMSPIVITTDNVTAPVTVDESYATWVSSTHVIHAELRSGSEEFLIDLNRVSVKLHDSNSGLPPGVFYTKELTPNKGNKECTITITVAQNILVTSPIVLDIILGNEGYSASTTFSLIPVSSSDGCSYEITASVSSGVIDRIAGANGFTYSPNALFCQGLIYVGSNPPASYGNIYYSVAYSDNAQPLLVIGDIYDNQANINEYNSSTGIVIGGLLNHSKIRKIFVYLVRPDNIVVDWEDYAIEDRGFYVLEPSKSSFENAGSTSNYKLTIKTIYKENNQDVGTIVDTHTLYYKKNTDNAWSVANATNIRNGGQNEADLTTLGVTTSTIYIDFILMESVAGSGGTTELLERSDVLTINFVKKGATGYKGSSVYELFAYKAFASTPSSTDKPTVTHLDPNGQTDLGNGWSTTIPTSTDPIYISKATFTDYTRRDPWSAPVRWTGIDGTNGTDGTNGRGVTEIANFYLATNDAGFEDSAQVEIIENPTQAITGKWLKEYAINVTDQLRFLWMKTRTKYSDNTTTWGAAYKVRDYVNIDTTAIKSAVIDDVTAAITTGEFSEPIKRAISDGLQEDGSIKSAVIDVTQDAVNAAVTSGTTRWVKYTRPDAESSTKWLPTGDSDVPTKNRNELSPASDSTTVKWVKEYIYDTISGIQITENQVFTGVLDSNGNVKAGISIIANNTGVDPSDNISKIILNASQIRLNGNVVANNIQANGIQIKDSNNNINCEITTAGILKATGAEITGAITATSGSFTGAITANSGEIKGDLVISPTRTIDVERAATNVGAMGNMIVARDGVIDWDTLGMYLYYSKPDTTIPYNPYASAHNPNAVNQATTKMWFSYQGVSNLNELETWLTNVRHHTLSHESTEISSIIAGLSGSTTDTIAAWFGGSKTTATTVFNNDGSGYLAGGKFTWDANGNVSVERCEISGTINKFVTLTDGYSGDGSPMESMDEGLVPSILKDNVKLDGDSYGSIWELPRTTSSIGRIMNICGHGRLVSRDNIYENGRLLYCISVQDELVQLICINTSSWVVVNRQSTSNSTKGSPFRIISIGHGGDSGNTFKVNTDTYNTTFQDIGNAPSGAFSGSTRYAHCYTDNSNNIVVDLSPSFASSAIELGVLSTPKVYTSSLHTYTTSVEAYVFQAINNNNKTCWRILFRCSGSGVVPIDFMIFKFDQL